MASAVYLLCTFTSALCAALLLRQHRRAPSPLVWWSGISFVAMAAGNALVFLDLVIWPGEDLLPLRALALFLSAALLVYGLVWEGE